MARASRRTRAENPPVRWTAVPVDLDGDDTDDVVYIVRYLQGQGTREQAIRAVAGLVDPDARIDLQLTRVFKTKYEAEAHASDIATDVHQIDLSGASI